MLKLFTLLFLTLNSYILLAQITPSTPTSIAEASMAKPAPIKGADPKTGMVPTYQIGDNVFLSTMGQSFYKALKAAGLEETLKSRGPITLFMPDDAAFAKLSKGKIDSLYRHDRLPQLIATISYHAIPGKLKVKDIAKKIDPKTGLAKFTTLSGGILYAKLDANHNIVLVDETGHQAIITQPELPQYNGYIHVIDTVLQPKDILL